MRTWLANAWSQCFAKSRTMLRRRLLECGQVHPDSRRGLACTERSECAQRDNVRPDHVFDMIYSTSSTMELIRGVV